MSRKMFSHGLTISLLAFALVLSVEHVNSQQPGRPSGPAPEGPAPGGGTSSGATDSTSCSPSSGSCAVDGSSNSNTPSLQYDAATGKLSGTFITNQCVDHAVTTQSGGNVACEEQTIPTATGPAAIATLGRVGLSLKSGLNIYSAFEAGFGAQTVYPCKDSSNTEYGECSGGLTVVQCEYHLSAICEAADIQTWLFLDNCGGHADPYHFHADLACDYTAPSSGHASATGVGLDGVVIYGLYEDGTTVPTDLDVCNGHMGVVPTETINGISITGGAQVYHYHMTDGFPHTIGCFGPVSSVDECKALYSQCDGVMESTSMVVNGVTQTVDVDLYCPCEDPLASSSPTTPTASTPTTASPTKASTPTTATPTGSCVEDAASPCEDCSHPTCEDGSAPDDSTQPPSCSSGTPKCTNGADPTGPGSCSCTAGSPTTPTAESLCSPSSGTCSADGTSNSNTRNMVYDSTTGKFSGTFTTNQCVDHAVNFPTGGDVRCETQTIGDVNGPAALAVLGRVGMSLKSGLNIYSAFEAGFGTGGNTPYPCVDSTTNVEYGRCSGGLTVAQCEMHLTATCAAEDIQHFLFLDECGGHANPYHFHADLACDYTAPSSGHAPATGVGLDGVVIYALYEDGTTVPTDLDACNGHVGPVPADTTYGISAGSVYHYHMTDGFPNTIGCFGPVASVDECKALYSQCDGVMESTSMVVNGVTQTVDVDLFCPCQDPLASSTPTSASPTTAGATPTTISPTTSAITPTSLSPTATATSPTSPSPTATATSPTSPSPTTAPASSTTATPTAASSPTASPTTASPTTSTSTTVAFESLFPDLQLSNPDELATFEQSFKSNITSKYPGATVVITEIIQGSVRVKSEVVFPTLADSEALTADANSGNVFSSAFTGRYGTPIISAVEVASLETVTVPTSAGTSRNVGAFAFFTALVVAAFSTI